MQLVTFRIFFNAACHFSHLFLYSLSLFASFSVQLVTFRIFFSTACHFSHLFLYSLSLFSSFVLLCIKLFVSFQYSLSLFASFSVQLVTFRIFCAIVPGLKRAYKWRGAMSECRNWGTLARKPKNVAACRALPDDLVHVVLLYTWNQPGKLESTQAI